MENLTINHLAVFVCAILNLALGALWYSPFLFYRAWSSETKLSEEQLSKSIPAVLYGLTFLFALVISYNLAFFLGEDQTTPAWGTTAGFLAGFGWSTLIGFILGSWR